MNLRECRPRQLYSLSAKVHSVKKVIIYELWKINCTQLATNFAIAITNTADEKWMLQTRTHYFHMTSKTKVLYIKRSCFDPVHNSCKNELRKNIQENFLKKSPQL